MTEFIQRRKFTLLALVIVLALIVRGCAMQPREDRTWLPYLANTTVVTEAVGEVTLNPVTDWRYDANGPVERSAAPQDYEIADLRRAWFVLEPQPGSTLVAHTFILFEFEDDRLLGLTIEARREADETYSAVRGAFNAYELTYLWGSARDLLTRRAVYLDHDVYVYPLQLNEAQLDGLFASVIERTEALSEAPRFYNTFFSNCTNELAKAVNLDWHYAFILTGRSDEYLYRRGLIPGESFETANARADLAGFIRRSNDIGDPSAFDRAVLAELRARLAETAARRVDAPRG